MPKKMFIQTVSAPANDVFGRRIPVIGGGGGVAPYCVTNSSAPANDVLSLPTLR